MKIKYRLDNGYGVRENGEGGSFYDVKEEVVGFSNEFMNGYYDSGDVSFEFIEKEGGVIWVEGKYVGDFGILDVK